MSQLRIETARLLITEFDESMAECVHINSLDENTRRLVPDEVFATVQEAHDAITFLITCYGDTASPLVYPVLLQSGENIGYVQAVPLADEWEVGYHIAAKHTGNGYASEAVDGFLPVIMRKLGIERIWGICRADNAASRRVLEKCGFSLASQTVGDYHGEVHELCKYLWTVKQA